MNVKVRSTEFVSLGHPNRSPFVSCTNHRLTSHAYMSFRFGTIIIHSTPSLLRSLPICFVRFGILWYMRACIPTHHTLLYLVTFLLSDHHPYTLFPFTVSMSWIIVYSDLLV